ncbi:hypothetical protein M3Y94_00969800 [Aphelenchoides besseyi]|nr:hypothetical protein M3Y94_00969800 [Aphelenchoides besseyi]
MRVYYNTTFSEMLLYQKLNKESRIYEKDELYGFVFIGGKKRCEENATYIIREPPIAPQITKCSSPQCSPQAQVPLAVEYWPLFAFILLVIFMFFITSLVHEYSERVCAFQQAYDVLRQQLNDTKGI